MRIALAQVNTTIGAFEPNLARARERRAEVAARGARLFVDPDGARVAVRG